MNPKIKYDVNLLGTKNKKSMMKNFFFYEETMQHNESTIYSLVVQQMFPCKEKPAEYKADFRLEKTCIFCN